MMTTETVTALRVWTGTTLNGFPRWQCVGRRDDLSILKAYTLNEVAASLWKQAGSKRRPIRVTWQPSPSGYANHLVSVAIPAPEGTAA